jgi:hypothetical protein
LTIVVDAHRNFAKTIHEKQMNGIFKTSKIRRQQCREPV